MTEENKPFISLAWREWLEMQDITQLESSLRQRVQNAETQEGADKDHTLREIAMIEEEMKRRDQAAKTRADFFPRITIRSAKDASLIAQLLHEHAREVIATTERILQFKRLKDLGFPVAVHFVVDDSGETTDDFDRVLQDLGARAIDTAELLGCVSEEIIRLKDAEGVELSEEEAATFKAMTDLVDGVKGEES